MRRSYLVIVAVIVVVAVTTGAVASTRPDSAAAVARPGSGPDSPPPNPEWVNPDGTVDPSKAPEYVHVAGPNGETVVCTNGEPLRVPFMPAPPPPGPASRFAPGQATDEDYVYRCGEGANPHLNPQMIPISQDPLKRDQ